MEWPVMTESFEKRLRRQGFLLASLMTGAFIFSLISVLQSHLVLGIPLSPRNFVIPSLVGGTAGLLLGRIYFRLRQRERRLRETEGRLQTILDSVHAGIILIDPSNHLVVDANDMALQMLETERKQFLGSSCHDFICPTTDGSCPITDLGQVADSSERTIRTATGHFLPVLKTVTTVTLDGRPLLLESFIDISDRKRSEEAIQQLAYYDPLTGLPNRTLFKDRLGQTLSRAQREKSMVALLFLDLDRFKNINDTLGHASGDQLLIITASRLQGCIRRSDTVSRLGGDEFVVILNSLMQAEDASSLAQKILAALSEPVSIDGHEVASTASIGIAIHPADGADVDTLLRNADTAMYEAKGKGRNTYRFFSEEMNIRAVDRLELEAGLRRALERGELRLHYQPQIQLATGMVVGMESLVRWDDPVRGSVPPATFIPLAEESGLIIPLGEWVIRTACAQVRTWQDAGHPPLRVGVNLSVRQFQHKNLLHLIQETLRRTGIEPSCLELELTEASIIENSEEHRDLLLTLKEMGIQLSIDDFGTAFSSMVSLSNLPVHRLKIPHSFTRMLDSTPSNTTIVRAIIALAHSLKLRVVAEGVETAEQLAFLSRHHCDEGQGYYFAPPMSADQFGAMLEKGWARENICFFAGENHHP
jgi:diguanylate cyclase (GGDEF)-like protein/PAS domain S-box-containing protein